MVTAIDPFAFAGLVEVQYGIVSRRQCREHGISADAALRNVRTGRWSMPNRGAFATFTGDLSHEAQVWAALLGIGNPVAASHETALWLAAPKRIVVPSYVTVAIIDGRNVQPLDGVTIRHLADLGADRVLWNASPPRVRPEPATLDVVHRCRTDDGVVAAIASSVSARITTVPRLREALTIRPRMHNRDLVREVLDDVADGAESALERRDLLNDRAHGLPSQRQVIRYSGSKKLRVDVIFDGDGLVRRVRKELDGRVGHAGPPSRLRDFRRDNEAEEQGEATLRYGWEDEVGQPCAIAGQQLRVLHRNGWRLSGKCCGPYCTALD